MWRRLGSAACSYYCFVRDVVARCGVECGVLLVHFIWKCRGACSCKCLHFADFYRGALCCLCVRFRPFETSFDGSCQCLRCIVAYRGASLTFLHFYSRRHLWGTCTRLGPPVSSPWIYTKLSLAFSACLCREEILRCSISSTCALLGMCIFDHDEMRIFVLLSTSLPLGGS